MIAEVYPADQCIASLLFTDVAVGVGPPLGLEEANRSVQMSHSHSGALASVRIRIEDGVDNLSVEAEKEWLRDADQVARPQRKTANTAK